MSRLRGDVAVWQPSGQAMRWCDRREVHVSIDDLGFRQGVTAVERLRTYEGRPFAVAEHLERFDRTTFVLAIDRLPKDQFASLIDELLRRNANPFVKHQDVGITLFATPGLVGLGQPSWAIHLNALDAEAIDRRRDRGVPLVVTDQQQPAEACWPRALKVRNRLHYYCADRIATASSLGPDAAGLLIDADGSVTETSTANLAIVRDGRIISPPAGQVLGGVTLGRVRSLATSMGIQWCHQLLFPQDLIDAQEVWLMGTDTGLWFANAVDRTPKATPRLLRTFQAAWPPVDG